MPRTKPETISKNKKYKKNKPDTDSDDSSDSSFASDYDSDSSYYSEIETPKSKKNKSKKTFSDDCSENSDDLAELHKTLQSLFPSRYMDDKVKCDKKKKKDKKKEKPIKKHKSKKYESESEEDEEEEDDIVSDEETVYEDIDSDEEEEDDDEDNADADEKNYKITFTIGGQQALKNKVQSNLSVDEYGSDDEKTFMKETYEDVEPIGMPLTPSVSNQSLSESVIAKKSKPEKKKVKDDASDTMSEVVDIGDKYKEIIELKKILVDKLKTKPNNQIIKKALKQCEHSISKLIKNARSKNAKVYEDMINFADTQEMADEFGYFKKKLSNKEQLKIMNDLNDINKFMYVEKPYRLSLLQSNIPPKFKAIAIQRLNQLSMMEPGEPEYFKLKNWVDNFMRIPFGIYKNLTININDGIDKCSEYVVNAKKQLDNCVFGLNSAKMQIMQMVGQWISNPGSMGTAIAIHGPPGTGKCMIKDTPILMYDGTIKMVQDVKVGDIVMGDDSTPRNVLSLGRGQDELYDIIPSKGDKYGVNSEHILCLKQSGLNRVKKIVNKDNSVSYKGEYFDNLTYKMHSKSFNNKTDAYKFINNKNDIIEISVKNYLKLSKTTQQKIKGYRVGIDFNEKPVPFDPYIIGVWIGDGTSSAPEITNQDAAILHYIKNSIKSYNLMLTYYTGYTYRIGYDMHDNDSRNNKNYFIKVLKDLKLLNNKHIPDIYKINSRSVRLQVLAGIIDTDGHYSCKGYDIIQKNKTVIDDIIFLARSLGYSAYKKLSNKSCTYKGNKIEGTYYRIFISGSNLSEIPVKCLRKRAEQRLSNKNILNTGITVNHTGFGDYYGFTLDGNHRYVLGDFTVTHNTSLVKDGISKILGREFAFIALGGCGDSSFLEGHSYTYEGSTWGKIVQILTESKCMNPVIYFDELDKVSDTARGQEIIGILTHLTDTTQNNQFHDKYFSEIELDLSKCLFIFSYNDERLINPILKDRMYRIVTKGYDLKEKLTIARNYMLPKIREQVGFGPDDIVISDEVLSHIISNQAKGEEGVRNLKRTLEIIHTKLNLYRLVKPETTGIFEKEMGIKVTFPYTLTKKDVDTLVKVEECISQSVLNSMYL